MTTTRVLVAGGGLILLCRAVCKRLQKRRPKDQGFGKKETRTKKAKAKSVGKIGRETPRQLAKRASQQPVSNPAKQLASRQQPSSEPANQQPSSQPASASEQASQQAVSDPAQQRAVKREEASLATSKSKQIVKRRKSKHQS